MTNISAKRAKMFNLLGISPILPVPPQWLTVAHSGAAVNSLVAPDSWPRTLV
jgi:hypothetical protein